MKIPSIPTLRGVGRPGTSSLIFLTDTFTDVAATVVTSHIGELGATWTRHASSTSGDDDTVRSNRLMGPAFGGTAIYYSSGIPSSGNYEVTASILQITDNNSSNLRIAGRMSTTLNTCYYLGYNSATDACSLVLLNNGAGTTLATTTIAAPTSLTVRMVGDQISGYVDGVLTHGPVTDAVIGAPGRAGFQHAGNNTTGAGLHLDSISATIIVA